MSSNNLSEFVASHWQLSTIFIIAIILFILNELWIKFFGPQKVTVKELVDLMNSEEVLVIDIREPKQFKEGHITNAINLKKEEASLKNSQIAAYKNKKVVLVCNYGNTAQSLALKLHKDIKNILVLKGGMTAWKDAHMLEVKK